MAEDSKVPEELRHLAAQLGRPRAMRRASVSERWMKCTKEACACGSDEHARHGPYFSVTWAEAGKTRSRLVRAEQLPVVRQQIEADREFRRDVAAYRQASQHWADAQLAEILQEAASDEAAKKGGSKRHSRAKSPPKSRRW
ncbi:MAG: hypothetical protein HY699_01965 [Deltaproteobacteria bacterium]|nr:hypothetical protein [Deltaproteobacteria bacterium]